MRAGALALVSLILLAGCNYTQEVPLPGRYLTDDDGDAEPRFDILAANFTELNGSLVLRLTIKNYAEGMPLFDAVVSTTSGDHFARVVYDPTRSGNLKAKAESGRWDGGQAVDVYEACWLPNFPTDPEDPGPWWIFVELLHDRTGLADGGSVTGLSVQTHDIEGPTEDEAVHEEEMPVRGGENAYADRDPPCPLFHERTTVY